jgi:hypothetical protein
MAGAIVLPVIDLDLFREAPTSVAARGECLKVRDTIISNQYYPERYSHLSPGCGCADHVGRLLI